MGYKLEQMTEAIWVKVARQLPEMWRNIAERQGWPSVAIDGGIAFSEGRNSWLCRSPVFIRDISSRWYFFHFENESYCFRIESPSSPQIEFVRCSPRFDIYERLKSALASAFEEYGFYGLPAVTLTRLSPIFPALIEEDETRSMVFGSDVARR
ncbi:hypothetical protein FHT39_003060 [Mitsuaria sp. BK045]|uniref:hypothetical protein n=1 Tax=unclassified Roseateles TaxID=2626991 RepID=UPI001621B429|nr:MULTISPECIES: hypothetical protein [unclassified Roseateles]MBB3294422.1 hypothetical protein [Mitsuaria sp. BK041]MBB3363638.1 hypothetical protein [Mitsuaria sp. BK045]